MVEVRGEGFCEYLIPKDKSGLNINSLSLPKPAAGAGKVFQDFFLKECFQDIQFFIGGHIIIFWFCFGSFLCRAGRVRLSELHIPADMRSPRRGLDMRVPRLGDQAGNATASGPDHPIGGPGKVMDRSPAAVYSAAG